MSAEFRDTTLFGLRFTYAVDGSRVCGPLDPHWLNNTIAAADYLTADTGDADADWVGAQQWEAHWCSECAPTTHQQRETAAELAIIIGEED